MIEILPLIHRTAMTLSGGEPEMVRIPGVGLWCSCRSKFIRIRKSGTVMRCTAGQHLHHLP